MKEEILKLRKQGYSYNKIVEILKCAKSTVAYHCSEKTKQKTADRSRKWKEENKDIIKLLKATDSFRSRISRIKAKSSGFGRGSTRRNKSTSTFNHNDILNKFGIETKCYLTGEPINLFKDDFNLDHIVPSSRGGSNNLDNVGITTPLANLSKSSMTVEEYIEHCKKVLINFNYDVIEKI